MEPNTNFEHKILEKDIERLSKEVHEYKKEHDVEKIDESILRSVIGSRISQSGKNVNYQGNAKPQQPQEDKSKDVLPDYMDNEAPEIKLKVEQLIETTFQHGIDHGIGEAKKMIPFILDSYHDALTAKMFEELKNRGLIK
ncbi:MAG: hypothetical protein PHP03_02235 [Candidatus Pacebacteria bacterium]|nr:hypothetical protein [Candidatus Paceibacterota bacterium]